MLDNGEDLLKLIDANIKDPQRRVKMFNIISMMNFFNGFLRGQNADKNAIKITQAGRSNATESFIKGVVEGISEPSKMKTIIDLFATEFGLDISVQEIRRHEHH